MNTKTSVLIREGNINQGSIQPCDAFTLEIMERSEFHSNKSWRTDKLVAKFISVVMDMKL